MKSALVMPSSLPFFHFKSPLVLHVSTSRPHLNSSSSVPSLRVLPSSDHTPVVGIDKRHPIVQTLQSFAKAAILVGAAASMSGKLAGLPAKAEPPATFREQTAVHEEEEKEIPTSQGQTDKSSSFSEFVESSADDTAELKLLVRQKLENGEREEAVTILKGLVSARPEEIEWKFLLGRLFREMGQTENARNLFEEILTVKPLSFEVLFENSLLMDSCGEGETVIKRLEEAAVKMLEEALKAAEEENKVKEARDERLLMAQIKFLKKNVEEALEIYQELEKEDPSDFRPYFCKGMIYSLLDRHVEAKEQFAKYRELSPNRFDVEGYLNNPLSRNEVVWLK